MRLRRPRERGTRLFFATDIHGSDVCFRKWLNAARVYEADALIMGGDLTGKLVVAIVEREDSQFETELFGEQVIARDDEELDDLRARIRKMGRYDVMLTAEGKAELDHDETDRDSMFREAVASRLTEWVELADERLASIETPAYWMLGNDDFPELAETLRRGSWIRYAEDQVYELPGGFELASVGYSTPTPWDTARELSEEDLADVLSEAFAPLTRPHQAIVNLHCPPYGSHLDQAPALDANLRPVVRAGMQQTTNAGSKAVRDAILATQPMLGLHGHVHESAGVEQLGKTLCINPGSDYGNGVLQGAIVDFSAVDGVRRWQLIQG